MHEISEKKEEVNVNKHNKLTINWMKNSYREAKNSEKAFA
jgi:hypothetical protein